MLSDLSLEKIDSAATAGHSGVTTHPRNQLTRWIQAKQKGPPAATGRGHLVDRISGTATTDRTRVRQEPRADRRLRCPRAVWGLLLPVDGPGVVDLLVHADAHGVEGGVPERDGTLPDIAREPESDGDPGVLERVEPANTNVILRMRSSFPPSWVMRSSNVVIPALAYSAARAAVAFRP